MDSKEYAWKWIAADEVLSHTACDLVYALLTAKAGACAITLYDGQNTNGTIIAKVECPASRSFEFAPAKPVYCRRGLSALTFTDNVDGVFIQWRPRLAKEG